MENVMATNQNFENTMAMNQGLINPMQFKNIPEQLKGIRNKRPEEKIYIVMFTDGENENRFQLCAGRQDCYESIGRILVAYPNTKIYESVVLVEVLGVNRDNEAEWFMKHPHNAPTIYQFCKSAEKYFPNSDFHIDDYATEQPNEDEHIETHVESSAPVVDEMTNVYKDMLKEKENS